MSEILVTGGAGAVGSNLTEELLRRGHDVTVLDDLSSGHRRLVPASARLVEGSVTDDDAVAMAFDRGPEYVMHLAALFANQNSVDHPEEDLTVNGLGTMRVLQASADRGVRKLLFVSSSCVYGNKELMRETDHELDPHTPYAVTKLLGEQYSRLWTMQTDLEVVAVRLFNCYGPHEFPGRYRNVVPNFFDLARQGKPLTITGTGEETRDFTFVQDTVAGMLGALLADTGAYDVFNIGSGRETTIRKLAETINELTGNDAGVEFVPRRSWDLVTRRVSSIDKAREAFGYEPRVAVEDGLAATHAWFESLDA
jgi:UDP-glucose 4-epimerase